MFSIRMVDATNHAALAEPATGPSRGTQWTSVWYVSAVAGAIAIVVGAGAFYAGRQSATLDLSKVTSKWKEAQKQADAYASERDTAVKELARLKGSIGSASFHTVDSSMKEADRIRQLTAQVASYKNLVDKSRTEKSTASMLAVVLSSSNAKVLPFKFVEPIRNAVVNLAMAEGGEAAFIASSLPADHHYQIWFVKKDKADITRGQSFTASNEPTILELGAGTLTGVTQILVTEGEAAEGDKPSSPPVMTLALE